MISVIICDFDDTLVSELQFIRSGYSACAKIVSEYGIDEKIAEKTFLIESLQSYKNVFDRSVKKLFGRENPDILKRLIAEYRYHRPNIKYEPDVKDFIKECCRRNIKLGIITDGDFKTQSNKLSAVNAIYDFQKTIITSEYGDDYKKPSEKAFIAMADYFKVQLSEIMYIGDNPKKDFAMSAKIPITTIRITRPNSIYKDETYKDDIREHFRINNLMEIFSREIL